MNKKLIFRLSLFGLAMAVATVFWIPSSIEPVFWLVIFIVSAYLIAKNCNTNYFLHGFLTSLVNCVWITSAHILFYDTYTANHLEEAEAFAKFMPGSPRLAMLLTGPVIGLISGLILDFGSFLFCCF
jgi:hypothetical protein